jgi:hypothetical protein
MVKINPETQKTRSERLTTVITLIASALIHIFLFVGGVQFYRWAEEVEKKERLMIIQRITEVPRKAIRKSKPPPGQTRAPESDVKEQGEEPPPQGEVPSDGELEEEIGAVEEEIPPPEEKNETTISVVTDLPAATFTLSGPVEYLGSGTFWTKKDAPTGAYTATFHPATGHKTPSIQTKTLEEETSIVFVGKYTRSIEVKVIVNIPGATFEIRRPDGEKLPMKRAGTVFLENLPKGTYTITFHEFPGHLTPAPQKRLLGKEGKLSFTGTYVLAGGTRDDEEAAQSEKKAATLLDRRVQMIVKSYPPTSIEESFDYIRYPEIIIKRSNFQTGWCQVYLVLNIDGRGNISSSTIKRPREEEMAQFETLIRAVKSAVGGWRFDSTQTEVHVDVRFYVE